MTTPEPREDHDLAACSDCGVWPEGVQTEVHHGKKRYYVACTDCGNATEQFSTEAEAITAWNRRRSPRARCTGSPPMTDAEKIARTLTEAQRKAVLGKTRWLKSAEALDWPLCGTVQRMRETPHKWEATPLGLAVRKIIEREA